MPRYFISTLIYFWLPVAVLSILSWNKFSSERKKTFILTLAVLLPATFAMEYVYLWADIWTFSEEFDPLLGIRIWGAPIEEFSFWFGAPPFILLVYFVFDRFLPKKARGHG